MKKKLLIVLLPAALTLSAPLPLRKLQRRRGPPVPSAVTDLITIC